MNRSPWIEEVSADRPAVSLKSDVTTDVVIVGAGIAGMSTAFFLLTNTTKKVIVLEQGRVAHGATGHNAGMVVSVFERPLQELAREFSPMMAADGQREIETGWELLDEMIRALNEPIAYHRSIGYGGLRTREEVVTELETIKWEREQGLTIMPVIVADSAPFLEELAGAYDGLYEIQSQKKILHLLDTTHVEYIAAKPEDFGVINSALLCEKLLQHFEVTYPDRFSCFENTHVSKIVLHEDVALLDAGAHTVQSSRVILCTNGFEDTTIFNTTGLDIDTKFHHLVSGVIGFMSAYVDDSDREPGAHWYTMPYEALAINDKDEDYKSIDPFIYTSRRPHKSGKSLVAIGGPELHLEDRAHYDRAMEYPKHISERFSAAVKTLRNEAFATKEGMYEWHGLMGYTPTGVRVVGAEPKNPILMYNLGCNGIGILPSIAGGLRISKLIQGEKLAPSMFDPKG